MNQLWKFQCLTVYVTIGNILWLKIITIAAVFSGIILIMQCLLKPADMKRRLIPIRLSPSVS